MELYDSGADEIHQLIGERNLCSFKGLYSDTERKLMSPRWRPIDVQLDCDEKTIVRPDVLVLCDVSANYPEIQFQGRGFYRRIFLHPRQRIYYKAGEYMTAKVRSIGWAGCGEKSIDI